MNQQVVPIHSEQLARGLVALGSPASLHMMQKPLPIYLIYKYTFSSSLYAFSSSL